MYSKTRIYPFTEDFYHKAIIKDSYEGRLFKLRNAIDHADYVVIGAGARLSAAAGIAYGGKRFTDSFTDFIARYGLTDMYSSAFYPFQTEKERWAYWARHILMNRLDMPATNSYRRLFSIISEKDYFVITTNVDGQFEKSALTRNVFLPCKEIMLTFNVLIDAMRSCTTMKISSGKWCGRQRIAAFHPDLFHIARCVAARWMCM